MEMVFFHIVDIFHAKFTTVLLISKKSVIESNKLVGVSSGLRLCHKGEDLFPRNY